VVVTVDGATPALPRLLRRGLLVAAIAAAGWLLSVLFAGGAAADDVPTDPVEVQEPHTTADQRETQSGGLLDGLLGGVVDTVSGFTQTVVHLTGAVLDTTASLLAPVVQPPADPIIDLPSILPAPHDGSSSSGSAATDRADAAVAALAVVAPAPVAPVAAPVAPPVVEAPAQEIHAVATVPAQVTQPAPAAAPDTNAAEHAGKGDTDPRPVKAPAAPAGPGSTVSTGHDSFGGARGTHGVLTSQATLHPADAGFTTRSRAVNAAGRNAGLPATSPD